MRDFSKEHLRRKEYKKRLVVDIEVNKANCFLDHLKESNITFTQWINNHINSELENKKNPIS